MDDEEGVRFADILTTAAAVANYLGQRDIAGAHVIDAVAILLGEKTLDDLGRPVSPLLTRGSQGKGGVEAALQATVKRWFERVGRDANRELSRDELAAFVVDVRSPPES